MTFVHLIRISGAHGLTNSAAADMVELRELDVRAAKKQVCKIPPETAEALTARNCVIRGGVVKKAKGGKKKPSTA